MTDDERRTVILDALESHRTAIGAQELSQTEIEIFVNWMLRLMYLSPTYESAEAAHWILRVLYYDDIRHQFGVPLGPLAPVALPLPQAIVDEINHDLENPPPGLSYAQLMEDINHTDPAKPN